jgi:cell division protein FtsB
VIALIVKNWQLALYLILGGLIAYGSWSVKSAYSRAAEADKLAADKTVLVKQAEVQQKKLAKAEDDRVLLSAQLADMQEQFDREERVVIKTITKHVRDDRACDIPVEVLKSLNVARGQPE